MPHHAAQHVPLEQVLHPSLLLGIVRGHWSFLERLQTGKWAWDLFHLSPALGQLELSTCERTPLECTVPRNQEYISVYQAGSELHNELMKAQAVLRSIQRGRNLKIDQSLMW